MSRLLLALAILFTLSITADAAVYKGQKTYKKKCKVCHGGGQNMAIKFTQKQWTKYFRKKGKRISSLHINNQRVADQLESFHRKGKAKKKYRYSKMQRHLLDFFREYAKDSDSVPACN